MKALAWKPAPGSFSLAQCHVGVSCPQLDEDTGLWACPARPGSGHPRAGACAIWALTVLLAVTKMPLLTKQAGGARDEPASGQLAPAPS